MDFLKSIFTVRGLKESMSFRDIVWVVAAQWRLFAALGVVALLGSILAFNLLKQYSATGTLVVHDSENSTLQAFSSSYFGDSKSFLDDKRGSSSLSKHTEYLRSMTFFEQLASDVEEDQEFMSSTVLSEGLKEAFDEEDSDLSLAGYLRGIAKIRIDSDFAIRIGYSTANAKLSSYLTNRTLELAMKQLKAREMTELAQVQEFIQSQKNEADERYAAALKEISAFQRLPQNLVGLSSKEKLNEYISDLLIRVNEIELKISENEEVVRFLRSQLLEQNAPEGMSSFGPSQKIEEVVNENRMLRKKRQEVQSRINEVAESTKSIPHSASTIDEMRRKAELEFANFKSLSAALAKLQIQKISIDNGFEVLERALPTQVGVQYSFPILLLIGLLLAQISGLFWIYTQYLLLVGDTGHGVAQFVVDGSVASDPRFYIENGQIRFRPQPLREKSDRQAEAKSSSE